MQTRLAVIWLTVDLGQTSGLKAVGPEEKLQVRPDHQALHGIEARFGRNVHPVDRRKTRHVHPDLMLAHGAVPEAGRPAHDVAKHRQVYPS